MVSKGFLARAFFAIFANPFALFAIKIFYRKERQELPQRSRRKNGLVERVS
jgi:hypothetical protein